MWLFLSKHKTGLEKKVFAFQTLVFVCRIFFCASPKNVVFSNISQCALCYVMLCSGLMLFEIRKALVKVLLFFDFFCRLDTLAKGLSLLGRTKHCWWMQFLVRDKEKFFK